MSTPKDMSVYARWRPLAESEIQIGEIAYETIQTPGNLATVTATPEANAMKVRPWGTSPIIPWESPPAFTTVFDSRSDNSLVYKTVVAPAIPKLMQGANCSFFAYGHSGSGKTHTMIGYSQDDDQSLGLSLAAVRELFELLNAANQTGKSPPLGIGLSVFELRGKHAIDLLNVQAKCDIRQGSDGKVHIRGQPEILDSGEVRVNFIVKRPCWTFQALKEELKNALSLRSVGSSEVHDQSSRSHAIIEFEIINQDLIDARNAVIDAKAKAVPAGKEVDDLYYLLAELRKKEKGISNTNQIDKRAAGLNKWAVASELEGARKVTSRLMSRVADAEKVVASILKRAKLSCLGTKLVFVDLAGAEYHRYKAATGDLASHTYQEYQEGCQINSDVMALKEVMRAWSKNMSRIPFRASPLTMILREYFTGPKKGISAMIVTLSPAKERYAATLDSLRYGSLVGAPGV